LKIKCTNFDIGWGSAPADPAGDLTALLQTPWLDFRGLFLRERDGRVEDRGDTKGEGKGE